MRRGDRILVSYCDDAAITATPLGLFDSALYGGTTYVQQTSVYRTASDGENSWSFKLTTSSAISEIDPFWTPLPFKIWHDASGSKTLTMYFCSDDTGLKDNELFACVRWGDEASPTTYTTGEFLNTCANYGDELAAGSSAYLKTDATSWTGGAAYTKYKIEVSGINPAEPCWVTAEIGFATPSANLFVCPDLVLS